MNKYLLLLILITQSSFASNYNDLDKLKDIVSFKSCEININNDKFNTKNCTFSEKKENVTKDVSSKKRNFDYEKEKFLNKKIDNLFDKIF